MGRARNVEIDITPHVVLPWIECHHGWWLCTRCDSRADIGYEEGHAVLPHAWFTYHRSADHVVDQTPSKLNVPPNTAPDGVTGNLFGQVESNERPSIDTADARILTGADAQRILRGENRDEVIARRKAILAGETVEEFGPVKPVPPPAAHIKPRSPFKAHDYKGLALSTYINMSDERVEFPGPGKYDFRVDPHESVWLMNKTRVTRGNDPRLVCAAEVHRRYLLGLVEADETLLRSFRRAGIEVSNGSG